MSTSAVQTAPPNATKSRASWAGWNTNLEGFVFLADPPSSQAFHSSRT
jgi:hypothetical protein